MITEEMAFWLIVLGVASAMIILVISIKYFFNIARISNSKKIVFTVYALVGLNFSLLIIITIVWVFFKGNGG